MNHDGTPETKNVKPFTLSICSVTGEESWGVPDLDDNPRP
jgi:hypothetical protein